jgi:hypothetical protein
MVAMPAADDAPMVATGGEPVLVWQTQPILLAMIATAERFIPIVRHCCVQTFPASFGTVHPFETPTGAMQPTSGTTISKSGPSSLRSMYISGFR